MPARFEAFKTFGAINANTLTHVQLRNPGCDVDGVTNDTPIWGLYVVNNSAATLVFYAQGTSFRVPPGAPAPIELGGSLRYYTFTPSAAVNANEIQVIHKGPEA